HHCGRRVRRRGRDQRAGHLLLPAAQVHRRLHRRARPGGRDRVHRWYRGEQCPGARRGGGGAGAPGYPDRGGRQRAAVQGHPAHLPGRFSGGGAGGAHERGVGDRPGGGRPHRLNRFMRYFPRGGVLRGIAPTPEASLTSAGVLDPPAASRRAPKTRNGSASSGTVATEKSASRNARPSSSRCQESTATVSRDRSGPSGSTVTSSKANTSSTASTGGSISSVDGRRSR